jgi:hypothetical protein
MSHLDGRSPIEYTSSSHASLAMWTIDNAKSCKDEFLTMLHELEKFITTEISNFVHKSKEHVVRLQPGALRSMPGTVPQRAHRDFTINTYKDQLPGQVYIGFMPGNEIEDMWLIASILNEVIQVGPSRESLLVSIMKKMYTMIIELEANTYLYHVLDFRVGDRNVSRRKY